MTAPENHQTADDPRWIEYVPIDLVAEADENPKGHADEDLDESLDRFGYLEPLTHDGRTGKIIGGHGRLGRIRAWRDAGRPAPEGITIDDAGVWRVPVTYGWSSRDDDEARAALVALNRLTELGGWRPVPLAEMLDEMRRNRPDDGLAGTGYSPAQVDDLLAEIRPPQFDPVDPSEQPRLDRTAPVSCPNCGHEFQVPSRAFQ